MSGTSSWAQSASNINASLRSLEVQMRAAEREADRIQAEESDLKLRVERENASETGLSAETAASLAKVAKSCREALQKSSELAKQTGSAMLELVATVPTAAAENISTEASKEIAEFVNKLTEEGNALIAQAAEIERLLDRPDTEL